VIKVEITYEDFMKVEMKTGIIMKAERIAGTAKLVRIEADVGAETRQIIAGIGDAYSEEELKNKSIVIVTNLQPKTLKGVQSNGMLLAATVDGKPVLLTVDRTVPAGAEIK
jgi:methionine--tRNA ligase beta chain